MKALFAIFALFTSLATSAAGLMSKEFEALLKENYRLKSEGTPQPDWFFEEVRGFADKGVPAAQYLAGMLLMNKDRTAAKTYFGKSSSAGCTGSMTWLGIQYLRDKNQDAAVPLLVRAAESGDATAQAYLSGAYMRGGEGFEKDNVKAYVWSKLAERQSYSDGMKVAIKESLAKIQAALTPEQSQAAEAELQKAYEKYRVVEYFFCGQANLDTTGAKDIPEHLRVD